MLLRIEFEPLEPYFFGNERALRYKGADYQVKAAGYFAKSENTPLQSTLFGALRYLGIVEKHADFTLTEEDKTNIGPRSFSLNKKNEDVQTFGKIKRISNLYLVDNTGDIYIKSPGDQPSFGENEEKIYQGFKLFYKNAVETQNGLKYFPEVDMKYGIFDGYVRVRDGKCVSVEDIFIKTVRAGIDAKEKKDAFYKKEYCFMKKYAFMFYAEVEDDFPEITDKYVKLGQGKTAFAVTVKEVAQFPEEELNISTIFPVEAEKVVLLSDTYVNDLNSLYSCCYFSYTDVREYRAMETNYDAKKQRQRYKKQNVLLKLMKAGSVFWVKPECLETFKESLDNKHAQTAGFNLYITGGSKQWKK